MRGRKKIAHLLKGVCFCYARR